MTVQILPTAALSPEYPMEPEQYLLILLLEKNKMIWNGTVGILNLFCSIGPCWIALLHSDFLPLQSNNMTLEGDA